jgi:plasmid stability protein
MWKLRVPRPSLLDLDVLTFCRHNSAKTFTEDVMSEASKRSTIYFDPQLHAALRLKAAHTHRSLSDIVNDAVRAALAEDQEDLAAFAERVAEPTISYEALLDDLKAHGKI